MGELEWSMVGMSAFLLSSSVVQYGPLNIQQCSLRQYPKSRAVEDEQHGISRSIRTA